MYRSCFTEGMSDQDTNKAVSFETIKQVFTIWGKEAQENPEKFADKDSEYWVSDEYAEDCANYFFRTLDNLSNQ